MHLSGFPGCGGGDVRLSVRGSGVELCIVLMRGYQARVRCGLSTAYGIQYNTLLSSILTSHVSSRYSCSLYCLRARKSTRQLSLTRYSAVTT